MKNLVQSAGNFFQRVVNHIRKHVNDDAERAGIGVPDEAYELPTWANRAMRRRFRRTRGGKGGRRTGHKQNVGSGIARRIASAGHIRGY